MSKFAFFAATALIVPSPVLAQIVFDDTPPPPQTAQMKNGKAKSDADKVVCQSQDTLGSRLEAHQVCMTVQQWQQYQAENRQKTQDLQGQSGVAPSH